MFVLTSALWGGVGRTDALKHHQGVKAALYHTVCDLHDLHDPSDCCGGLGAHWIVPALQGLVFLYPLSKTS